MSIITEKRNDNVFVTKFHIEFKAEKIIFVCSDELPQSSIIKNSLFKICHFQELELFINRIYTTKSSLNHCKLCTSLFCRVSKLQTIFICSVPVLFPSLTNFIANNVSVKQVLYSFIWKLKFDMFSSRKSRYVVDELSSPIG